LSACWDTLNAIHKCAVGYDEADAQEFLCCFDAQMRGVYSSKCAEAGRDDEPVDRPSVVERNYAELTPLGQYSAVLGVHEDEGVVAPQ
jgi:hypothetical protein